MAKNNSPPLVEITECPNDVIIPTNPTPVTVIPGSSPPPTLTRPAYVMQQPDQTTPQCEGCQQCNTYTYHDSTCDSARNDYVASPAPSSSQIVPSQCTTTVQTDVTGSDRLKGMLVLPACVVSSIPAVFPILAVTCTPSACAPDQACVTDVQQSNSDAPVQLLSPECQSVPSHSQAHGNTSGGGRHYCQDA